MTLGARLSLASDLARQGYSKDEIVRRTELEPSQVDEVLVKAGRKKRR